MTLNLKKTMFAVMIAGLTLASGRGGLAAPKRATQHAACAPPVTRSTVKATNACDGLVPDCAPPPAGCAYLAPSCEDGVWSCGALTCDPRLD